MTSGFAPAARCWERARVRALHHALATAWYGADVGDDCLLGESAAALARLAASARWFAPSRAVC